MPLFPRLTVAASATLLATPVLADITPRDVVDEWLKQARKSIYVVTFDEEISGGTLNLSNIVATLKPEHSAFISTIKIPPLSYHQRSNGTVEMTTTDDATLALTFSNGQFIRFNQRTIDMSYVISGTPDAMTHDMKVDEISYTMTDMMLDGIKDDAKIGVTFNGLQSYLFINSADLQDIKSNFSINEIRYDIVASSKDNREGGARLSGEVQDFQYNLSAAIPTNIENDDPMLGINEAIAKGASFAGDISYGALSGKLLISDKQASGNFIFSATAGSMAAKFIPTPDELMQAAYDLAVGSFALDAKYIFEGKQQNFHFDTSLTDFALGFDMLMPREFDLETMTNPMAEAFSVKAFLRYAGFEGKGSIQSEAINGQGSFETNDADAFLSFDRQRMRYGETVGASSLSVTSPQLPMERIEYSLDSGGFEVSVPLGEVGEPQDFTLKFSLIDLWVNDALWDMFDSTALLPRDPASVELDITGLAGWLIDFMNPKTDSDGFGKRFGELHSMTLKKLLVSGAGVTLTGHGSATFNNDDMISYNGIPAPTGMLDLRLTGSNLLIDRLIELGVLADNEAIMTRMGLGMAMVEGDGDDVLISHIEATGDGKVLANGARLK